MAPKVFFRTVLTSPHCRTANDSKRLDMGSLIGNDPEWALFLRHYRDPRAAEPFDDRSLTFTRPLRALLERGLAATLTERPELATFVGELVRVTS